MEDMTCSKSINLPSAQIPVKPTSERNQIVLDFILDEILSLNERINHNAEINPNQKGDLPTENTIALLSQLLQIADCR
jgi:hypothetical protein